MEDAYLEQPGNSKKLVEHASGPQRKLKLDRLALGDVWYGHLVRSQGIAGCSGHPRYSHGPKRTLIREDEELERAVVKDSERYATYVRSRIYGGYNTAGCIADDSGCP
jgi:hypothetical protein